MKAIEAAVEHYKGLGTLSMEVPEWQLDGKPLCVYWTPLTLAENEKLLRGMGDNEVGRYADVLVLKAKDEHGNPLFTIEDKPKLRIAVDKSVVIKIGMAILAAPTAEQAEKNSGAIPTAT